MLGEGTSAAEGLLLGLDGGSTKTAGVIITSAGVVRARLRGAPSAIVGEPTAQQSGLLSSMVDSLCRQAGASRADLACCGIGLSGIDFENEFALQHRSLAAGLAITPERMVLVNDAIAALWGATARPAAALIQHGTGFTAAYRRSHGREALFDHLAVADVFDMRRALIPLVARMANGMAEPTPLKERALLHFGIADERDFCEAVYRRRIPVDRLLTTGALIFECWEAGDPAAERLVECAIRDYAVAAGAMIEATGCAEAEAVFGGGLIAQAPRRFWARLAEAVRERAPGAATRAPDLSPELGAALMAGYRVGVAPEGLFERLRGGAAPGGDVRQAGREQRP